MYKDKEVKKNVKNIFFINVWRKSVFDIYWDKPSDGRRISDYKGNNKITELRTTLQRESQNS
jgi:hypothetical protein